MACNLITFVGGKSNGLCEAKPPTLMRGSPGGGL